MKKKLLAAVLAIAVLYLGWLGFESLGSRPYANATPLAPVQNALEVEGVYHIHTKFSDGHASVDELAAQASREKLDFLLFRRGDLGAARLLRRVLSPARQISQRSTR